MNPLVPTGWEAFLNVFGIMQIILLIWALVRVGRDPWLRSEHKIFLLVVSVLIPILGAAASLFITFRTNRK